jgi:transposase-like protein
MKRYSDEKKAAVLKRMLPPECCSPAQLSKVFGISEATLYNWRTAARAKGSLMPDAKQTPEQWSSENKFTVVVETARLNETELSAYCRQKGLLVEQVKAWRKACESANRDTELREQNSAKLSKADKTRIKELEKELQRKEKALAEAAALLVLRKKLEAFYHKPADE